MDTIENQHFVPYSEVSLTQGLPVYIWKDSWDFQNFTLYRGCPLFEGVSIKRGSEHCTATNKKKFNSFGYKILQGYWYIRKGTSQYIISVKIEPRRSFLL